MVIWPLLFAVLSIAILSLLCGLMAHLGWWLWGRFGPRSQAATAAAARGCCTTRRPPAPAVFVSSSARPGSRAGTLPAIGALTGVTPRPWPPYNHEEPYRAAADR
jgi:hypothetical protein